MTALQMIELIRLIFTMTLYTYIVWNIFLAMAILGANHGKN